MINSKTKPVFYGLYGEENFLLTDVVHCETLSHRTKLHNLVIEEHMHASLFQVFILESGKIDISIGGHGYLLEGPAIITVPEKTLHGMSVGKKVRGTVVTIATSFLEENSNHFASSLFELSNAHVITSFDKRSSFEAIRIFADNLNNEAGDNLADKKWIVQNYCNLLLGLICRLLENKSEKIITPDNRNMRYFKIFQKSVKKSCTPMKSIKQYALELNITSVHLNRICQSAAGKSALQVVHEYLIQEAEKFLRNTELHVSEIAYQLNFEDPAYFSRLFKKHTSISPKEFRLRN